MLGLLVDERTKDKFLADTGSVYSLIPFSSPSPASGLRLVTADRKLVACWGSCSWTLHVGGRRFRWQFIHAAVAFLIVGADFLSAHNLSVDLASMKLVHSSERWSVPLLSAPPSSRTFAAIGVQLLAPSPSQQSGGTREAGVAAVSLRGPPKPHPPATARSSPCQIFHRSKKGEFPTIHGVPDPSLAPSSTPKFRAPGKHKQTRLPGKVKSLRATGKKEGEYPSSAGSPGPHINVATPFPPPRATLPAPATPTLSHSPLHRQQRPVGGVSANLAAGGISADLTTKVAATAASVKTGGKSRDQAAKVSASPDYQSVPESYSAVLNKSKQLPSAIHNMQHVIDTSDRPVSSCYRRLDPEKP